MASTYIYGEDFEQLQTEIQQVWDANSNSDTSTLDELQSDFLDVSCALSFF